MTLYREIRRSRRLVVVGIALGYAMAFAVLVIRVLNTGSGIGEVLGSVALALSAAIAPTLAWVSLDRRPGLLPAAGLAALITGLVNLLVLPVALVMALIWRQAWSNRPVKVVVSRGLWWAGVALAMGSAISVFVLFAHLDPVCTETLADGTVMEVDPSEHGMESGWRLGVGSTGTSSQSGPDGPVSSSCSSDTVIWPEAVVSMLVSVGAIVAASRLWPVNTDEPASKKSSKRPVSP